MKTEVLNALHHSGQEAFAALLKKRAQVSFAESLTGGLIAATLVENSGASAVLQESYVTYSPSSKQHLLGVRRETVERLGVVSAQCAREMAEGARRLSGADWGVSATGLAGPDGGTAQKPVGTVFIGVSGPKGVKAWEQHFSGNRMEIRCRAAQAALEALKWALEEG